MADQKLGVRRVFDVLDVLDGGISEVVESFGSICLLRLCGLHFLPVVCSVVFHHEIEQIFCDSMETSFSKRGVVDFDIIIEIVVGFKPQDGSHDTQRFNTYGFVLFR